MVFVFFLIGLIAVFGLFLFLAGLHADEGGMTGVGCLLILLGIGGMFALSYFVNIGGEATGAIIVLVILAVIVLAVLGGGV